MKICLTFKLHGGKIKIVQIDDCILIHFSCFTKYYIHYYLHASKKLLSFIYIIYNNFKVYNINMYKLKANQLTIKKIKKYYIIIINKMVEFNFNFDYSWSAYRNYYWLCHKNVFCYIIIQGIHHYHCNNGLQCRVTNNLLRSINFLVIYIV
jgi:hypothetical protein